MFQVGNAARGSFPRRLQPGILAIVLSLSFSASAEQFRTQSIDPTAFPDYYTLDDGTRIRADEAVTQNLLMAAVDQLQPIHEFAAKILISLTAFVHHNKAVPQAREKYNRRNHFGSWRSDEENCLDVRGRVLARESQHPVTTRRSGERCVVEKGLWQDPYSGTTETNPQDLQIDHFVPLKNAYVMGAHAWPKKKKCWFANFLPASYHLVPMSPKENQAKSDKTPAEYLPPLQNSHCSYVKNWLKIKMVWNLQLVQPEIDSIQDTIKQNRCTASELAISADELQQTRQEIAAGSTLCQ